MRRLGEPFQRSVVAPPPAGPLRVSGAKAAAGALDFTGQPDDGNALEIGNAFGRWGAGREIEIGASPLATASNTAGWINTNPGAQCTAQATGTHVDLMATTPGSAGNGITLNSTGANVLATPFHGGAD